MNNVQLLISAGLIDANYPPNATDEATLNALSQTEVKGLIEIYNTLGAAFLQRNCNVTSVTPGPARSLGIVF
ncbi:MAG TPA: hypothetical protein VFB04_06675 [Terriglobales bacterium]|nr:hypothetical protein [Terriglobales bacterium]